ncbi:mannose-1-phosphate guanylyltransferase/mannose-6-phosphate isomerase [Paramixta manurensis]|uniref:mannose-1-phosphate guanylyltransferase n=1 Tax=Paramixta manurensis TaxID=2740817 RepID=A0A6M8UDS0_9GAMM|nr:mannose-1-phosphate guanylyltransferase/mannose-6-phosphate isomerase [Erwiniaceae bacterium PD-1]
MSKLHPVIMAGGNGSRLWPLSRVLYPKQFLALNGESTMLQETIERLNGLACDAPVVISNEAHRFVVAEQLNQINSLSNNIILEPVGRNTAPAIALAALVAKQKQEAQGSDDDPLLLVLAADHVIKDISAFQTAIKQAIPLAEKDYLVTFGIVPSYPETGYGYIKRAAAIEDEGYSQTNSDVREISWKVDGFVEKPDRETAEKYLNSGEYYWNSGMFLFKASRYLAELQTFRPDIYHACREAVEKIDPDLDFIRVNEAIFSRCPDESVDYAVMEKTRHAAVVPLDANWSDVGSWSSLWDISEKTAQGNVLHGDVISHDSNNSYVFAEQGLVSLVGVDDLVVVQTKDATLVARKDRVQDIKKVVEQIKRDGRKEHYIHREVYRPWGKYDSIDEGHRYQVKRITVKPGERLSLQMHNHRAEHWIVVAGTAKVTRGEETILLTENQSLYIPLGEKHSLENPGKIPLHLIEVRSGAYLEEDDIIRFEDKYGRI